MAYRFDSYDSSIVIDGFEKGIADSPYAGITDMRNVNVISIPGEVSVNFTTAQISPPVITAVVTGLNTNVLTFTGAGTLENRMAVKFTAVGGLTGVTTNTVYWVSNLTSGYPTNTACKLYSDIQLSSVVSIGGAATGSPTFTTYQVMGSGNLNPTNFTYAPSNTSYWLVDGIGQVWTTAYTSGTNAYWTFTGNTGGSGNANGNGIVAYQAYNGTTYVFVFRNSCIDYTNAATTSISWVYGWNPTTGGSAAYTTLKTANGTNNSHQAFVAPDNRVYYTDATYIGRFWETNGSNASFDPTSTATFTFSAQSLLPSTDTAQCMAFLGTSILVGGKNNVIYPWDRVSTNFSYPLLLPEYNVSQMVTLNTNTYIFVGNRGRIYVTNGTNATLYKKIPDHISGVVEPYFSWGGACTVKNQLYFGVSATTNGGSAITQYGGVWAIDTDTDALRLTNKLSYGTYAGLASAIIPQFQANAAGTGLYIAWTDGAGNWGIDTTSSNPYTGSQATIDSDLIPIGTFQKPRNLTKIEYRLARPLVSGESITIKTRLIFNTQNTGYTTTLTDSTVGNYSNIGDVNFSNAQWVQFQIVLNSTASSPSFVRLKEIRILGLVGPTMAQNQLFSI